MIALSSTPVFPKFFHLSTAAFVVVVEWRCFPHRIRPDRRLDFKSPDEFAKIGARLEPSAGNPTFQLV